jgi:predicted MFS family arabinose efflux permease
MLRGAMAFFVAPFPVALFQAIVVWLWPKPGTGVFEHPSSMFLAMCLYFYIFGLILGGPLLIFLRRRGHAGPKTHAFVGLVAMSLPVGLSLGTLVLSQTATAYTVIYNGLLFAVGGLVAGGLFWTIKRSDRQQSIAVIDSSEPHRPA